jgi:segregation and condensation protein A
MSLLDTFSCKLATFEGPLDYLLYLVQQGEITLADVPLHALVQQFVDNSQPAEHSPLEMGAEFVGIAATLMWLKSKLLLPRDPSATVEEDPLFEIRLEALQQIVEYCNLKKAAQLLSVREEQQSPCHYRAVLAPVEAEERSLGLEVDLSELARLFQQALKKADSGRGKVKDERWSVANTLQTVRQRLTTSNHLTFSCLFTTTMCREEIIVTFLALLELIKVGEITLNADGVCTTTSIPETP